MSRNGSRKGLVHETDASHFSMRVSSLRTVSHDWQQTRKGARAWLPGKRHVAKGYRCIFVGIIGTTRTESQDPRGSDVRAEKEVFHHLSFHVSAQSPKATYTRTSTHLVVSKARNPASDKPSLQPPDPEIPLGRVTTSQHLHPQPDRTPTTA